MSTCPICKKAEGVICRHYRHQEAGIIVEDEKVILDDDLGDKLDEPEINTEPDKPAKKQRKKKSLW